MNIQPITGELNTAISDLVSPVTNSVAEVDTLMSHQGLMEWQKIMLNDTLQLQTKVMSTNKISSSLEQLLRGQ